MENVISRNFYVKVKIDAIFHTVYVKLIVFGLCDEDFIRISLVK